MTELFLFSDSDSVPGPDAACFDWGGNEHFWGGGIITERDSILFYIDTIFETA